MEFSTTSISLVAATIGLIYFFIKWQYSYWERRGVPTIKPSIPFGNFGDVGKTISHSENMKRIYDKLKGTAKFCGVYSMHRPVALVLDLELTKRILTTDFNYFHDRGIYFNAKADPLSANMITIEGKQWKDFRAKFTQTFTSGKMKMMFNFVLDVAVSLKTTMASMAGENGADMEVKDLLASFTTDVIGVSAFGLECNTLDGPDMEFRIMGKKVFEQPRNQPAYQLFISSFPNLARKLGCRIVSEDVEKFYSDIINKAVSYREKNNVHRNDLLDIMIGLKNTPNKAEAITMNQIIAEAFAFFLAGFGTTSTMMSFTVYELALNPEIQKRLRENITSVLKKYDGKPTYEAVAEMDYLNRVFCEALRKYPPFGNLIRNVTKQYKVPGTDQILEKGTSVWVPNFAIHRDPEYYPDPEKFDPDRFLPEAVKARNPATYMPWGDGPRTCIGIRFAMMKARVAIVTLMTNFEFAVCDKTELPCKISRKTFLFTPENGIWLNVKKLSS